jgi:hypothetical protein
MQPLESRTRKFMESRFDCDFDRVLVHADKQANGLLAPSNSLLIWQPTIHQQRIMKTYALTGNFGLVLDRHRALTTAAVSMAISQFVTLGKSFFEKRFVEIYKAWLGPPGKPSAKGCLTELMANLPEIVQNEDIHPANFPVIGEMLNPKSGQVRHFMRSSAGVSSLEAYNASKAYIIEHLTGAWSKYRETINYQDKWYDVLTSSSSIFGEGYYEPGKALHTIEDSYAPGHSLASPLRFYRSGQYLE